MIIHQWIGTPVDHLPGIMQEARPQREWPYLQDWIVSHIKWDSGNRRYWIEGKHRESNDSFFWGADHKLQVIDGVGFIVLDWRFDLTNATYETGRHETQAEAYNRHFAERRRAVG